MKKLNYICSKTGIKARKEMTTLQQQKWSFETKVSLRQKLNLSTKYIQNNYIQNEKPALKDQEVTINNKVVKQRWVTRVEHFGRREEEERDKRVTY